MRPERNIFALLFIRAPPEISFEVFAVRRTVRAAAFAPRRPAIVRERSHASPPQAATRVYIIYVLRESRSSPPPHCGRLQLARRLAQPSAVGEQQAHIPRFAPKISKIPSKTRKITKKARKLLYDTIICTTFGASDPSRKTWIALLSQ